MTGYPKYYVSAVVNNGGIKGFHRLTPYISEAEARTEYHRRLNAYPEGLFLRVLQKGNIRKTIKL